MRQLNMYSPEIKPCLILWLQFQKWEPKQSGQAV